MRHTSLVGIDISGSSIKVLKVDSDNNVIAYGKGDLPVGVVDGGLIKDKNNFATVLTELIKGTKPQPILVEGEKLHSILCIPESKLFTHYFKVPEDIGKKEVEDFVKNGAGEIIPFELDNLYWDYHLATEEGNRIVTFVGVKKEDLNNYVEALTQANIKPILACGEMFALGHALLPQTILTEDYIIVDIGDYSTAVGLFSVDGISNASINIPYAGQYLTQKISDIRSISIEEADEYKKKFGLNSSQDESDVSAVIKESFSEIIRQTKEAKTFFEQKTGTPIKHMVLSGGTALLPGIKEFLTEQFVMDVQIAEPLMYIKNKETFTNAKTSIFFANAIGSVIYGSNKDSSKINLLKDYRYEEEEAENAKLNFKEVRSFSDGLIVLKNTLRKVKTSFSNSKSLLLIIKKINLRLLLSSLFVIVTLAVLVFVVMKYT